MSQENVEVVERLHRAWLDGDNEKALGFFAADADIDMTARPDGRHYQGPGGMFDAMRDWIETWDEYSFEPEGYLDAGDEVVLLFRERGRGKGSKVEVEIVGATIWTIRDGMVAGVKPYTDRHQALAAVGLSE